MKLFYDTHMSGSRIIFIKKPSIGADTRAGALRIPKLGRPKGVISKPGAGPKGSPQRKAPAAPTPGFSSSRYQSLTKISDGGMGTVFKAFDTMLKMDVAIKLLKPEIARDPDALAQLKAEAAISMRLSHEHIVRIHNIENEKGWIFLVMEYVDGQTLREVIDAMGALSLHSVLDIAHSCADALSYAHHQGVLHRDIKPENIMVNQVMTLKLLDFGLAIKMARGHDQSDLIEGSPGYLSPEQLHGRPLDARTDVFSMAAVVYELLTGQRAFPNTDPLQTMYDQDPAGLETLPPAVAQAIQWGLSREADSRYNSPAEFYAALEQVITPLL